LVHTDPLDFHQPVPQGSMVEPVAWVTLVERSSMRPEGTAVLLALAPEGVCVKLLSGLGWSAGLLGWFVQLEQRAGHSGIFL